MAPFVIIVVADTLLSVLGAPLRGVAMSAVYLCQWCMMIAAFLAFPRMEAGGRAWGLIAGGVFAVRAAYLLARGVPGGTVAIAALAADLALIALFFDVLRRRGHDPRWTLLYGLNPLVWWLEISGDFHVWSLLVVPVPIVLAALCGERRRYVNRLLNAALVAGLAGSLYADLAFAVPGMAVAVLAPRLSWILLPACAALYVGGFLAHRESEVGRWAALAATWWPLAGCLVWECLLDIRRLGSCTWAPLPASVSVVIPALNEGNTIQRAVEAAVSQACVSDVVVVDGGSHDDTVQKAREAGAEVVISAAHADGALRGRGGHINAGVARARGDVVAIVHADTTIAPRDLVRVLRVLRAHPETVGGAVGSCFDGRRRALRLVEAANDMRAALFGISFGDQVQFFRRRPVVESGGVPNLPLMEDVELSLRLCGMGRTVFLFGSSAVSPRSWSGSALRRTALVVSLVAGYLARRPFGIPDVAAMYRRYYRERR